MQSTDRQNDDHQPIDGAELNHHFAPDSNSPGGGENGRNRNSSRRVYFTEQQGTRYEETERSREEERRDVDEFASQEPEFQFDYEYEDDYQVGNFYEDILQVKSQSPAKPILIPVKLNQREIKMELDTGAARTLISKETWKKIGQPRLEEVYFGLRTYTGQLIKTMGQATVAVEIDGVQKRLSVTVVDGDGPSLLGRDWLQEIRLNWPLHYQQLDNNSKRQVDALKEFPKLFSKELGTIAHHEAELKLKVDAVPKFFRPRSIPFAIKEKVNEEIVRLENLGVLTKVHHAEWAAPIVVVPKPNGSIRLCGDFKVTVNSQLNIEQYPLPNPEDIFATLEGGVIFSKLDLSQAYLQLKLHPDSKKLVTINTPKGLFQFQRLPFGIASAPAIFQRVMDEILADLPFVKCFLDDLLVMGTSNEEHDQRLRQVFQRLDQFNIRLRIDKCLIGVKNLDFLGYHISEKGLSTCSEKIRAVNNFPRPKDTSAVRAFLGLINYYGKFIPKLSTVSEPLNKLLRKTTGKFIWTEEAERSWMDLKKLMTSTATLAHFNPKQTVILACDASSVGVGAVLAHQYPDGSERPIAFASKTLGAAERNYSQLDKEALALVFGVKKFHKYLYGRKFVLITDHKPLLAILGPKAGIPPLAAARLQRWALTLLAYQYELVFKKTQEHGNADALSRSPLPDGEVEVSAREAEKCYQVSCRKMPLTHTQIRQATRQDPLLSKVYKYVQTEWPLEVDSMFTPFKRRTVELTTEAGVLLWGQRVIVPGKLQEPILRALHEDHLGIVRTKALARNYIWWPRLDEEIEKMVAQCKHCQTVRNQEKAPEARWELPSQIWYRLHMDFAGPVQGKMLFVVVDARSKWPEVAVMNSTTATASIEVLREIFSRFGYPREIVSDNGPQFTSREFEEFTTEFGIRHFMGAPYHPKTNGLAERMVQTIKKQLTKNRHIPLSLKAKLNRILLAYRNTPHQVTETSPAEMLLKRPIPSQWDLLRPSLKDMQARKQPIPDFQVEGVPEGARVLVRDYGHNIKWKTGTVRERKGPLSYQVEVEGEVIKRHQDQLLPLPAAENGSDIEEEPREEPDSGEGHQEEAIPARQEETEKRMGRLPRNKKKKEDKNFLYY